MEIRLNKHIADLGIASRRKAEVLIVDGKVKVNDKIVKELGTKIDPAKDKVEILNQKSTIKNLQSIYIILHKPIGYITSTSDTQGRTVMGLLRAENCISKNKRNIKERLYPVGRLDKDSEGLVLLTNDGELTNKLTHPRYEHEKEYEITLDAQISKDAEKVLNKGMKIGDEFMQGIEIKKKEKIGRRYIVTIILKEGKNRQLRKMFGRLGYNLQSLKRTRMGNLKLGTLPVGRWKFISKEQIL